MYAAVYLLNEVPDFFPSGSQFYRHDPRSPYFIVAANEQIVTTPLVIGQTPLTIPNFENSEASMWIST